MILVTGATGQFGSKAIDHLLKKGLKPTEIAVLVRNEANAQDLADKGVQVRVGDYTDYSSLVNAFRGMDKLLLVSSNDRAAIENRTAQHINSINAAKEAGIKHVVYTSFVRKANYKDSPIVAFQDSHVQTEAHLIASGMDYTILQNGIYMEMIPIFVGDKVAESRTILFPAGTGKASYVLREELAEAAAQVLTTEGHETLTYCLTNSNAISFTDIAESIGDQLGITIQYESLETDNFESIMRQSGVPELYIGMFTMWAKAQKDGALDVVDDTLEKFLGRKPLSLSQFVAQRY